MAECNFDKLVAILASMGMDVNYDSCDKIAIYAEGRPFSFSWHFPKNTELVANATSFHHTPFVTGTGVAPPNTLLGVPVVETESAPKLSEGDITFHPWKMVAEASSEGLIEPEVDPEAESKHEAASAEEAKNEKVERPLSALEEFLGVNDA